jgi:uncharacterized membrane protein YgcG
MEVFSLRTANSWGIGNKGFDDGILVTLAMKERRARIELGKGMQRFISDADAKKIMDQDMTPRFSKGDVSGGLERGLERLMEEGRQWAVSCARSLNMLKRCCYSLTTFLRILSSRMVTNCGFRR